MAERILKLVGPLHVAGGLLLFLTGFLPSVQRLIENIATTDGEPAWSPFLAAVLGPTIASWGLLFGTLVSIYFASPGRRIWRALVWSVVIWAPLDTILCMKFGVYSGAILNAVVVVIIIGLLIAVKPLAYGLSPPPQDYA